MYRHCELLYYLCFTRAIIIYVSILYPLEKDNAMAISHYCFHQNFTLPFQINNTVDGMALHLMNKCIYHPIHTNRPSIVIYTETVLQENRKSFTKLG